ncbi:MAG: hypothetical protein Q9219_007443 [cf. Caloplaca sp. 3 TL-2023]
MADARPDSHERLQDGHLRAHEAAPASSPDMVRREEISADTHEMLRRVAQDASSQAGGEVSNTMLKHEEEYISPIISEHALLNGDSVASGECANDTTGDGAGHLNTSTRQREIVEAQPQPSSHNIFEHTSVNASPELTQANINALADDLILEAANSVVESEPPRIQAFAKLEFDDGEFYMNTYSVELGRDIRAARQAYERDVRLLQQVDAKLRKRSSSSGDISRSSGKLKSGHGRHLSGSIVSESGGIMGLDHSDSEGTRQRRGKKSKSATSSSQQLSRKSSMNFPGVRTDYQSLAMASLLDSSMDAQYVDPRNPMPSPESCPLVPIHPPASADGVPTSHKSISRKHVKIAFNFEKHLFEVIVLGRNGAFVDEEWYPEGDVQSLRSGSLIQIGGVGIRFLLPDVALGATGAENTLGSDPASFDLENEDAVSSDDERNEQDRDDDDESGDDSSDKSDENDESDELSEEETRGRPRRRPGEVKPTPANRPVRNRKPARGTASGKTKDPPKAKQPAKAKLKLITKEEPRPEPTTPPPKRKGPGRPPKNGIISKREQALLARQAKEAAKAAARGEPDAPQPGKGKGKSIPQISTTIQENNGQLQPNGKRKYKKRKTKAEIDGAEQTEPQKVRESTEHTDSVPPDRNAAPPPKPPKPMKPPKPPRSPSPVFDEATLTPEQLAKPQSSYVVLIHDALSNSKSGQMSLPQIYRAIERKYPFYKLRVQTTGWQSSVRHNLSQHPAFRKIERDGKGWMWGLVPEVSIEKEKRRRMTPPPMPAQGYYPTTQAMPQTYPYSAMPPAGSQLPYPAYGAYSGLPLGQRLYSHFPPQATASALPPALANAQVDTSSTYQSPYATGPSQQNSDPSQAVSAGTTSGQPVNSSTNPDTAEGSGALTPTPVPLPASASKSSDNSHKSAPSPSTDHPLKSPQPSQPTSHTPDVLAVVKKFKDFLLSSLSDNPRAESLIDSAINRVLNPSQNPNSSSLTSASGDDDHQEKAIMGILQGMLDNMRAQKTSKAEGDANGVKGDTKGGHTTKTFFQILESVSVGDSGTLGQPASAAKKETGGQQQSIEDGINSITEKVSEAPDQIGRHEDAIAESTTPAEEPRGLKRPLERDSDGAMDAKTLGVKRVAT